MKTYHKIQSVFKREPKTKYRNLIEGDYSIPEFDYLKNNMWVFTEKVDGTNIRVGYEHGKIIFGGRSDNSQIPATLVQRLNEKFQPKIDTFTELFGDAEVCLYGEGYGPKIQKGGGNYRKDQDFVLFDVMINGWWLQRVDVEALATKLEIDVVPIVGRGTLIEMVELAKNGITSTWGDFQAEGYVARPEIELKCRSGERLITKVKCKDFK